MNSVLYISHSCCGLSPEIRSRSTWPNMSDWSKEELKELEDWRKRREQEEKSLKRDERSKSCVAEAR